MKSCDLDRRSFLVLVGSAAAYTALEARPAMARGMMGMNGMGTMNGAGTAIDPPAGEVFTNPADCPNLSKTSGQVEVSIESKIAQVKINGTNADLYTYNGLFPGPTLRARRGDKLRINFKSSLPKTGTINILGHKSDSTNFHTHGFHVSPSGNSDNVMLEFQPGQSFVFDYDLSYQYPGSMCFYHPHVHGCVAEQYWGGQAGAIIIDDGMDRLAGYDTRILVLKDIELVDGKPAPHNFMDYMHGKEGPIVMVSGQVNPRVPIRPGEVQRWRVLNASNARFYNLSLESHQMHVIGTDAGLLDKPYPVNRILLSPGERIQPARESRPQPRQLQAAFPAVQPRRLHGHGGYGYGGYGYGRKGFRRHGHGGRNVRRYGWNEDGRRPDCNSAYNDVRRRPAQCRHSPGDQPRGQKTHNGHGFPPPMQNGPGHAHACWIHKWKDFRPGPVYDQFENG